ncbi:Light-sensor Protein kinase [Linum grandiflorum]
MEQFRRMGEQLGSLKALMLFRDNIEVNPRQCNLKFEERQLKWRVLEQPLTEMCRVFKEVEGYNRDSVEFHVHSLISTMPAVIEAIEIAGEFAGSDQEEIRTKRQYLVSNDLASRFESAWLEDRWILMNRLRVMSSSSSTKQERKLADFMSKRIDGNWNKGLLPCSVLVGSRDYQVKRRLGGGESFAVRHFFGNIDPMIPEIVQLSSLCHPNVLQLLCGFTDEDKKECFLVSELMGCRDIGSYIKEASGSRNCRRLPFSLSVAVDLMLQIARGMEYLHSKKVYHGNLNPSNILIRTGPASSLVVKVSGFGLSSLRDKNNNAPFIWSAPEILEEPDDSITEKSDVYSFAMVCFEILTGKVPFEDSHLQGDRMARNIRAGERPLFPSQTPKFVANFTKRCWHPDPNSRPGFPTICRMLRYAKKFLLLTNQDSATPVAPLLDYLEIDSKLQRRFESWDQNADRSISEVPFQMFSYKVMEMERMAKSSTSASESSGSDVSGDEAAFVDVMDPFRSPDRNSSSACSSSHNNNNTLLLLSSSPEATAAAALSSPVHKRSSPVCSKRATFDPWKTSSKLPGTNLVCLVFGEHNFIR